MKDGVIIDFAQKIKEAARAEELLAHWHHVENNGRWVNAEFASKPEDLSQSICRSDATPKGAPHEAPTESSTQLAENASATPADEQPAAAKS